MCVNGTKQQRFCLQAAPSGNLHLQDQNINPDLITSADVILGNYVVMNIRIKNLHIYLVQYDTITTQSSLPKLNI